MNKVDKSVADYLQMLADNLPVVQYAYKDSVTMTGAELKLTPYADKQEFEDEKEYEVPVPGYNIVNHFRRLCRAWKKNGIEGVKVYTQQFTKPAVFQ